MHMFAKSTLASAIALAVTQVAVAGTAPFFVPITTSTAVGINNPTSVMHPTETTVPFTVPAGVSQKFLTSMKEIEADPTQSTVRTTAGDPDNATMWDMLAYDPSGRYIYIPHETLAGAGVTRYDTVTDKATLVMAGDSQGVVTNDWSDDFGAFDPARWTPNGTVLAGEEWSGLGRIIEILDPMAVPANPIVGTPGGPVAGTDWRVLNTIALVSQEGINFSQLPANQNKVIYYIDEDNSGSIYKLVLANAGDYTGPGQTFVLKDADNLHVGTANYNGTVGGGNVVVHPENAVLANRTGPATWVPITDAAGVPLTPTNPFVSGGSGTRPGRVAADEVNGTPYGRPEDIAIGKLPNGNEAVYFAATSENSVYTIEETAGGPVVRVLANSSTPRNVGFQPTTGTISAPDNLAIDELGNIFIIEDSPNTGRVGGDIWFARDINSDGVAESLDHFMSLNVAGSEGSGMIFHPTDPSRFVVTVQHPISTDLGAVPLGQGDALLEFDLTKVVPPTCEGPRSNWQTFNLLTNTWVRACSSSSDFNYVQQLEANGIVFPNP